MITMATMNLTGWKTTMTNGDQEEKKIAKSISEQCTLLTDGDTGFMYRLSEGVYKRLTQNQIDYYIISTYTDNKLYYNRGKKNTTLDFLKELTFINSREIEESTKGSINLINGVYFFDKVKGLIIVDFLGNRVESTTNGDVKKTMVNFKYHPLQRYYSFNQIPVNYNKDAECPAFDKFLGEVFGEENKQAIYEFIGYILMPTVIYQRALILVGSGKNGKTTFLDALIRFLGKANISKIPLQYLEGKFALFNLKNKLANIVSDLPSKELKDTGNAKSIVTDDTLSSNIKNVQGNFVFKNITKMLYSCNTLPRTKDKSSAFYRRWRMFICNAVFEDNKDVNILDKITTPEELSGLLNKALLGIERLKENKGFPDTELEVKNMWDIESNPIAEFINIRCIRDDSEELRSKDLFEAFNEYRANKKLPILHPKSIGYWIRQCGIIGKQKKDDFDNWFTYYQGIKLRVKETKHIGIHKILAMQEDA